MEKREIDGNLPAIYTLAPGGPAFARLVTLINLPLSRCHGRTTRRPAASGIALCLWSRVTCQRALAGHVHHASRHLLTPKGGVLGRLTPVPPANEPHWRSDACLFRSMQLLGPPVR